MFRKIVFYDHPALNQALSGSWHTLAAGGLMLLLFGITVLLVPQLLIALIASLFMGAGAVLLGLAWRTRQLERLTRQPRVELYDDPLDRF